MAKRFIVPILFLVVFALLGLIGLAVLKSSSFFEYQAVSIVRVPREGFPKGSIDYETFKQTQADLIRTGFICNNAVLDPAVANSNWVKKRNDAATQLSNLLRVSIPEGSEIIQIGFKANDKKEAKDLLDAVVNAYLKVLEKEAAEEANDDSNLPAVPKVAVIQTAQIIP